MIVPARPHPAALWPSDWFETAQACLWCDARDPAPLLAGVQDWFFAAVPGEFAISRCRQCASLLLEMRPAPAHLVKAYAAYYTHAAPPPTASAPPRGGRQMLGRALAGAYARRRYHASAGLADRLGAILMRAFPVRRAEVDAAFRYLPPRPAAVLDYGCGNGEFLARAAALGHDVLGVDFDPAAAAVAQAGRIAVLTPAAFAALPQERRFDAITAAHLIEHVADPVALLRELRQRLRPGGRIFLEVPNAQASGLAAHGRFWRGLEAPRHFSLPSEAGLRIALASAGLVAEVIGERAFARGPLDASSQAAAAAAGGGAGWVPGQADALLGQLNGPEFLTCLARAG